MVRTNDLIDFHVHGGPSLWERKHDVIDLAEQYREQELGGVVVKSHFGNTFTMVGLARKLVPDVDIYSTLTLNSFVGGFNPTAVELAMETGVSVIWFPTFSSSNFQTDRHFPFSNQSLSAIDDNGDLKPEVTAVLEALRDGDRETVLGNGHLSPAETRRVFDKIEELGVTNPYKITHADSSFMNLSIADQVELAERGAYIEKCYLNVIKGDITLEEMVDSIYEIGVDCCVLSTDHGPKTLESAPVAFGTFIEKLSEAGMTDDELETMASRTPREILPDPQ